MLSHARETHPDECCGAIVVRGDREEVRRFTNVQGRLHAEDPVANPRDATRAYAPEPAELYAAIRAGEAAGSNLAVFYHSHSVRGSYFSGEDRARAMFGDEPAYPEVAYVVVSNARVEGEVRAFRWSETAGDFVEVSVDLHDGDVARAPVRTTE